jgi:hypothetical protein
MVDMAEIMTKQLVAIAPVTMRHPQPWEIALLSVVQEQLEGRILVIQMYGLHHVPIQGTVLLVLVLAAVNSDHLVGLAQPDATLELVLALTAVLLVAAHLVLVDAVRKFPIQKI